MIMKKLIFLLLIIAFLMSACSTNHKNKKTELVNNYDSSRYLIAKGFGMSGQEAVLQAKAELSNIFETRIKSDITSNFISSSSTKENDSFSKRVEKNIRVFSDIKLSGVEILKTWQENGEYAAIAALDKNKAAEEWRKEISTIDMEIKILSNESDLAKSAFLKLKPLKKISNLWIERKTFLSRLRTIDFSGEAIKSNPIDIRTLLNNMSKIRSELIINIDITGEHAELLKDITSEILTENGLKLQNAASKADAVISGNIKIEHLPDKDKNFKFARVSVSLSIIDSNLEKQIDQVSESIKASGISYEEAEIRAIKKISASIKEKLLDCF